MAITTNKDIDYIVKDFNSAVDGIISFANVNFGPGTSANRLWTDFNADSFSRNWLEIVAFVADIFFFYLDNQATQSYLQTATIRSAIEDIAKQFGFTVATATSASGDVTFTGPGTITVTAGTSTVTSSTGEEFFAATSAIGTSSVTVAVIQGRKNVENFEAEGLRNEEFDLAFQDVLVDTKNINTFLLSPTVTVSGNEYKLVSSFIRHNGEDSPAVEDSLGNIIGGGGRVFTLEERANGTKFIRFGDGIFGRKLSPNQQISVTYRTGGGSAGNISAGSITSFSSVLGAESVTNDADFSGGVDEQSIEQLRDLIPASLRTLDRAVAEQDYSDLLKINFSEVFDASTEVNDEDIGVDLNIYVLPEGEGIPTITDNSLLVSTLTNYLDRRKMVTVQFEIRDAYGIDILIDLEVFVEDTASRLGVSNAIRNSILDFFSLTTGGRDELGIGFAENILHKDIDSVLATIDGIKRYEIRQLTYSPRIQVNSVGILTEYQVSNITLFSNIQEREWYVGAAGLVTEDIYTLVTNDDLLEFNYDSETGIITYESDINLSKVAPGDRFITGAGSQEQSEVIVLDDGSGSYEQTKITTVPDYQGIPEITEIIVTKNAINLYGKYFTIYDEDGSIAVWFDVDDTNLMPSHGKDRTIEIDINSTDDITQVATKLQTELDADSKFNAVVSGGAQEVTQLFFASVNGTILDTAGIGQYFILDNPLVYVWYNVTDGAEIQTDPALGLPYISVEVQVLEGDSPATIASKTRDAINLVTGLTVPAPLPGETTIQVTHDEKKPTTNGINLTVNGLLVLTLVQGEYDDTVTITNITNLSVDDAEDGDVATEFTFTTVQQGTNPDKLDGTYFLIYDNAGSVAFWIDVDNSGTTIPTGASSADRAIEITTITTNMSANDVATEIQLAINSDSQFTASVLGNEVEVTDIAAGVRTNAVDGLVPTGFTIERLIEGADAVSINEKYWLLNSSNNITKYYVWYNNTGTPGLGDPSPAGTDTGIEISITLGATAIEVANNTASAIDLEANFNASSDGVNTVTITNSTIGDTTDVNDGNTNFTFNKTVEGADTEQQLLILGVDAINNTVTVAPELVVSNTVIDPIHGSINNGETSFESTIVYERILGIATNLSVDTITDINLDLSVASGVCTNISNNEVIDNENIFIPNKYATGEYYLVDSSGYIWDILENTSNTIITDTSAENDGIVTSVFSGEYKIVKKLQGDEIVFKNIAFEIQYNTHNTFTSLDGQFNQIGTIGDSFFISKLQENIGTVGIAVDLLTFDRGEIRLGGEPELDGISTEYYLLDSSGQEFEITAIENILKPSVLYSNNNRDTSYTLAAEGQGEGERVAQGFQVPQEGIYSVVSFHLNRQGNTTGDLIVEILEDDGGGLPDATSVVATTNLVNALNISESGFNKISFTFDDFPTLVAGTQYHLVLRGDDNYIQDTAVTFTNSGPSAYSYTASSGALDYTDSVDLSVVELGNYFEDDDGNYYKITFIDNTINRLIIVDEDGNFPTSITIGNTSITSGNCYRFDRILVGLDTNHSTAVYNDGEFARYDGVDWHNSTSITNPDFIDTSGNSISAETDMIFSVEGTKFIKIDSNLVPTLGSGATITKRYYNDDNQISFLAGLSSGLLTSADVVGENTTLAANGKATVDSVPDSKVDNFVFRTSRYSDDVVNLRLNEVPQISEDDINITIFGGVE